MEIRLFNRNDVDELERIHAANFAEEFFQPDFLRYLCAFVVEDDEGVITMGGVRPIVECVTVTDKSRSPTDRIKALYQILNASIHVSQRCGFDQIYAFSQNPKWARRLQKNGFRPPQGQALILDL